MGLFDIFKKKKVDIITVDKIEVSNNSMNLKEEKIIAPCPIEVEERKLCDLTDSQYDKLYDGFDNDIDKYEEIISELEYAFECEYSYNTRLRLLKAACKAFDKCVTRVAPYWYQDKWFMDSLHIREDDPWNKVFEDGIENHNMIYDFHNIYCLRWLLEEYTNNVVDIKTQLKEQEHNTLYEELGSDEAVQEYLKYQNDYSKFCDELKQIIIDNPDIIQKDIKKYVEDEFWHRYIAKTLKEWADKGIITRVKSGNSYTVSIK